ncbi:hypothetical protein TPA0905_04290 [Streptomyces olivaceus]|nr:hypothetical protein TPA0905_04290 [Streptomyces olivaceus]
MLWLLTAVSVGFLVDKRKGCGSYLELTTPATWGRERGVSIPSRRSVTVLVHEGEEAFVLYGREAGGTW